jgi:hypothetical protein
MVWYGMEKHGTGSDSTTHNRSSNTETWGSHRMGIGIGNVLDTVLQMLGIWVTPPSVTRDAGFRKRKAPGEDLVPVLYSLLRGPARRLPLVRMNLR